MNFDISIIICAHNPRPAYLRCVLDALQSQTLPARGWELLLIDNASDQPLASAWDLSWHSNGRHVLESELGLSAARRRGIREATGNILVFVDDDNVLHPEYLARACKIGAEWPRLGTWGSGAIRPQFEIQPPDFIGGFFPNLALRETAVPRWANDISIEATPWGAGLCVRKEVAREYCRHCDTTSIVITGRRGTALLSGEDIEISHIACEMGLGTGVFPELTLTHLIPKERMSLAYLLRVFEDSETSRHVMTFKWRGILPNDPFRPWGLLSIVKNLALTSGLDRTRYLAGVRAAAKARRIIMASRAHGEPRADVAENSLRGRT